MFQPSLSRYNTDGIGYTSRSQMALDIPLRKTIQDKKLHLFLERKYGLILAAVLKIYKLRILSEILRKGKF